MTEWTDAKIRLDDAWDLTRKRALVVGAHTPSGRAIAEALVEAGAAIAITSITKDEREAQALLETELTIRLMGRQVSAHSIDATTAADLDALVERVAYDLDGIDVLVTAPDLFLGKPAAEVADAEWSKVLADNLTATFNACRAAGRQMAKQGGGRIIAVASALGERGVANCSAYCAAQGGILNLVRALAQEWAPNGVTVNAIATGWMEYSAGLGDPNPEANRNVRFIPMRRAGRADELGCLAVYLASDASGYVSGQIHFVDGGLLAHL